MDIAKIYNKLIKEDGFVIIDANNRKYVIGKPIKENPIILRLLDKKLNYKLIFSPDLYFGEAYTNGSLKIENGNLTEFLDIVFKNFGRREINNFSNILNKIRGTYRFLTNFNFISESRKNVAHHYDIDEKIYKMFLDKDMQYSCAYFRNDNLNLDQAQEEKKNILIKKLNIKENMKVLDIGCGWGGMAMQIAKDTGSYVKGITLSQNQYELSQKRLKESNLEKQVDFELIDYRELSGKYDRIISVGMFEHVGVGQYNKFFNCIKNLLTDDGIMILHSIGTKLQPHQTNPWIRKYIFPGGYIPSLSEVTKVVENQDLWISDLEIWRMHYAKTLQKWRINFNNNRTKISSILDEKFCRMWEFYLLISEYSFRNMGNMVFHMQITKNPESAPITRDYIYN